MNANFRPRHISTAVRVYRPESSRAPTSVYSKVRAGLNAIACENLGRSSSDQFRFRLRDEENEDHCAGSRRNQVTRRNVTTETWLSQKHNDTGASSWSTESDPVEDENERPDAG